MRYRRGKRCAFGALLPDSRDLSACLWRSRRAFTGRIAIKITGGRVGKRNSDCREYFGEASSRRTARLGALVLPSSPTQQTLVRSMKMQSTTFRTGPDRSSRHPPNVILPGSRRCQKVVQVCSKSSSALLGPESKRVHSRPRCLGRVLKKQPLEREKRAHAFELIMMAEITATHSLVASHPWQQRTLFLRHPWHRQKQMREEMP